MTRDLEDSTRAFEAARARLFKLAYRMLGSIGDAEDAVQDLYLRWRRVEEDIKTPEAWLVTACARLCIDRLRAAKRERATYEGPWLPEPIVIAAGDASADLERADDMTMAMLLVLERLTPRERAAYILREAFDYDYAKIGDVLRASPAACRQLASRAARRLRDERPRFTTSWTAARDLARRFADAARRGDVDALASLLAEDATCATDGGGKVTAARNVLSGADRVARFILGVMAKGGAGVDFKFVIVNGAPGWVLSRGGAPFAVATIETDGDRVCKVFATLNPDKLAHVKAPQGASG
ncbi:MAG TPA: RNA polymerase sigma-70 factor [Roseiarcus sp.]|nr:RNA polymerase sigma-70 factor [Roseiarcus sp.]